MKRLKTSDISASTGFPVKEGTLEFLQDAYKEGLAGIVSNLVENPQVNTIYILSGCVNSTVAPIHTLSAGVLYYNGEIYLFDGATFTLTGLQKAYARIETTQFVTNADPVEFTDGVNRNVHDIRKIVIEGTTTNSGLPEFKDFIRRAQWLKGDTKEVVCDSTYLAANFDGTGLGKLERTGWAIMNGNNGTVNDNGKVVIAYGSSYPELGATGGEVEHQLTIDEMPKFAPTDAVVVSPIGGGSVALASGSQQQIALQTGDDQPHNNMQPYVVRLRIQKI